MARFFSRIIKQCRNREIYIVIITYQVKTDVSKDEEEEKIGEYKIKKRKNDKIEEEQK